MIYQHPLAYLIGIEGAALLRAWAGDHDREFTEARLREVRRLLDSPLADHGGVDVLRSDSPAAYRQWAPSYDEPNSLFDVEEPHVREILDVLPVGVALDAACGTGRYSEILALKGYQVFGMDNSAEMLARARVRVPDGDFRPGTLDALPLDDDAVDVVVCALALSHVPDLGPVLAEFARVLRPGGHVVISDAHPELILRGSVVRALGPAGEPGLVATYRHLPSDYVRAALGAGLQVRGFEEIQQRVDPPAPREVELSPGPWEVWPWSLMALVPEASWAAGRTPLTVIWHFRQDS